MTSNQPHPAGPASPGPASPGPASPGPAGHRDVRDAVLAYLGVAITGFLLPLEVYLISRRRSAFACRHAAEALRVSWAALLYAVCALIIAGMLALDSVKVAAIVVGPLALAFWLVLVSYLIRAARMASRGEPPREFPGWLRVSPRR